MACYVLWLIWKCRNDDLYNGNIPNLVIAVNFIRDSTISFIEDNVNHINWGEQSLNVDGATEGCGISMGMNAFRVNFDGVVDAEKGCCGRGVVISDREGCFVASHAVNFIGIRNPLIVEV